MKTLLGVLFFLSLTAFFPCSDAATGILVQEKPLRYCQDVNESRCFDTIDPKSVTDIPPVGCAIPMAQLDKVLQAQ